MGFIEDAKDKAEDAAEFVKDKAGDAADFAKDKAEDVSDFAKDKALDVKDFVDHVHDDIAKGGHTHGDHDAPKPTAPPA
jgi:gas vesicle protein